MFELPRTGQSAIFDAVERLSDAGVENPVGDARILLAEALGIEVSRLSMVVRDQLPDAPFQRFLNLVSMREARRPVSQILGWRWFYGRKFKVTEDTLDPRPETELLVAEALTSEFERVLDLGTGTGAIAISLLAEAENSSAVASDLSPAALKVAEQNAQTHEVSERLTLKQGSWFEPISGMGDFDLIVSNPPYIAEDEMKDLAPEVYEYEPHMALTPGGDGLSPYRLIASTAASFLRNGGRVLVEIGPTQGEDVSKMFQAAGFERVSILPDLDGRDRIVSAWLAK